MHRVTAQVRGHDTHMEAWRADRLRWMTLEAAALKPDTDVRVQPETCHRRDAGPRPKLATNCRSRSTSAYASFQASTGLLTRKCPYVTQKDGMTQRCAQGCTWLSSDSA